MDERRFQKLKENSDRANRHTGCMPLSPGGWEPVAVLLMDQLEQEHAEVKRLRERAKESFVDPAFATALVEWAGEETIKQQRAEIERLRKALLGLKNGECWCDRYYDPSCGHQDRCDQARAAAEAAGGGG